MQVSINAQRALIWWALAMMVAFMLCFVFLIKMVPLPAATLNAEQVAAIYRNNSVSIRIGSIICSWVAAFMVPLAMVITMQMRRMEQGWPIWSVLQLCGGCLMSMFLVFPPLLWGVAAFSPGRPAEITLAIHELANLTLVTTDQYFIFQYVAIAVIALTGQQSALSPFPRWFGYYTIWTAIMFELGAFGFIPRTGPFAWNGLFVFWIPLTIFGVWIVITSTLILGALKRQAQIA
ncbi:hypothetical protein [Sphingobium sp.]|uniref:hypothetical protein n=1 Tax=Sphingobium sp. TaxID=1912891 RepID=UPI0028BF2753|nr:hypothetical protein [Sphingobium sp.]